MVSTPKGLKYSIFMDPTQTQLKYAIYIQFALKGKNVPFPNKAKICYVHGSGPKRTKIFIYMIITLKSLKYVKHMVPTPKKIDYAINTWCQKQLKYANYF